MEQGRNAPCTCGSGKKWKRCCGSPVAKAVLRNDLTGERIIKISDQTSEALQRQLDRFKQKFGRDPGPSDPVFFDPDSDTPVRMSEEKIMTKMVTMMREAGFPGDFIYAYEKTGIMVYEDNLHLFTKEDLEGWNSAIREFRSRQKSV